MSGTVHDVVRSLARQAEVVCRRYLSNGRREGRYWLVGDVHNTLGRSLFVRLHGPDSGPGAAGKWTDAATGEHGDLLDLIARNRGFDRLCDTFDEARSFLGWSPPICSGKADGLALQGDGRERARWLFKAGIPIAGTPAEAYLRARGITVPLDFPSLRFHPALWYRAGRDAPRESWPAMLAAVTAPDGAITGIQRTWLDRRRPAKAPLADPRRALGHLLGNGVRFGRAEDVLAAGEGIETMLAFKSVLPTLPMIAALSANHLAALTLPPTLVRLYVARDNDGAGYRAAVQLHERGAEVGVEVLDLVPAGDDFNTDICRLGPAAMLDHVVAQLVPGDDVRFAAKPLV